MSTQHNTPVLRPLAQPDQSDFARSLLAISPMSAKRLVDDGAILVDIREWDEHLRERIPGAHHLALSMFDKENLAEQCGKVVIFYCRSGARAVANAPPGADR